MKWVRLVKVYGMAQLKQTISPSQINLYSKDKVQQGSLHASFLKQPLCLQVTLAPSLTHPTCRFSNRTIENTAGFMPYSNSENSLDMLTMLNLRVEPLGVLRTLKKNHWLLPLVLMSFCRMRSYSLYSRWYARNRLPDQKLELNSTVGLQPDSLSVLHRYVISGDFAFLIIKAVFPSFQRSLFTELRLSRKVAKQLLFGLSYFSQTKNLPAQNSLSVNNSAETVSILFFAKHLATFFLSIMCENRDQSIRAILLRSRWQVWLLRMGGSATMRAGQWFLGWQDWYQILFMSGLALGSRFLTQIRLFQAYYQFSIAQSGSLSSQNQAYLLMPSKFVIIYKRATIKFYYQLLNYYANQFHLLTSLKRLSALVEFDLSRFCRQSWPLRLLASCSSRSFPYSLHAAFSLLNCSCCDFSSAAMNCLASYSFLSRESLIELFSCSDLSCVLSRPWRAVRARWLALRDQRSALFSMFKIQWSRQGTREYVWTKCWQTRPSWYFPCIADNILLFLLRQI